MINKQKFEDKKIANLVTRRDYAKLNINFSEPNLLEIQQESYSKFLNESLGELISSYFPIRHSHNNLYEVKYEGYKLVDLNSNEEQARHKGKTYQKALYVNLSLINNETGEVKKASKRASDLSDGIFFSNIPMMTVNGTFIINGIEKFVVSQIVRSPGAYILSKSKIKLNNKKKIDEGFVCELLPSKGSMMNFYADVKSEVVNVRIRKSDGTEAPVFFVTQLLKAFGMNQDTIREVYADSNIILKTLSNDKEIYRHDIIFDFEDLIGIRKTVHNLKSVDDIKHGSPIETKLRKLIFQYSKLKETRDALGTKHEKELGLFQKQNDALLHEANDSSTKDKRAKPNSQLKRLGEPIAKIKAEIDSVQLELNKLLDLIIIEKAAKDLISKVGISTRTVECNGANEEKFCYQDILVRHFCERRQYDLTSAGRVKINQKMRLSERIYQRVLAQDLILKTGKVFLKKGTLINKDELDDIKQMIKDKQLDLTKTIKVCSPVSFDKMAPTTKINYESIRVYADNNKYDDYLEIIGTDINCKSHSLILSDLLAMVSYTAGLSDNVGNYDDIDHLGNKRLRLIHEQLKNKLIAGMARVEKHIKDKLASLSLITLNDEQKERNEKKTTIKSVVNTKSFQQVVKAFFNSYQLTQFIDQQNPLSELTNKRRISAMGDGGIRREDPNLDIRDVHYSHYGRICPIETPEGMNIGLIMSLASYAKVDEHGFLITPFYKVKDGTITKEVEWLTATREDEYIIGESTTPHNAEGKITADTVVGRYRGLQESYKPTRIDYVDVNPRQVVSIAAGAIPFLENDDTTRALMGANMQRQATPLISPYAPIVGTGAEYKIAHDSGLNILAKEDGEVTTVDGDKIVVTSKSGHKNEYKLIKYRKTNQDTCTNQIPIVEIGQKVKKDDVIADGPAMNNGELALGRNPLVAYTTWHGYNFEDAIIISQRLVQDDWYTSIQIEEHEIKCLRTKNGDEEISRDLPNTSDELKRYLDEDGIIMIGAEVKEGDVLVGKVSPKGITDYSPEEKLLHAIFGAKSRGFKDSSLKVSHGGEGIVAAIKRFKTINGDELDDDVIELIKVYIVQKRKIQIGDKMAGRHGNKGIVSKVVPIEDMPHLEDGTPIDIMLNPLGVPSRMNLGQVLEVHLGYGMRCLAKKKLFELIEEKAKTDAYCQLFGLSSARAEILKTVAKKYLDKNDITSLKKFKDLDLNIILNKCGLSTESLSCKASTPVFCGAKLDDIADVYKEVGMDIVKSKGKMPLIDGRTGERFDGDITVGVMYMLKLDHMVDDKIHARAVGPYSKITQQPLGGRSQNGGQRFGEMEVWALEAYGATHNLRELLTIKSDDVRGRNSTYNNIVKGKKLPFCGLPESFKLLSKQLQGLCLAMTVYDEKNNKEDINNFTSINEDDNVIVATNAGETTTIKTTDYDQDDSNAIFNKERI